MAQQLDKINLAEKGFTEKNETLTETTTKVEQTFPPSLESSGSGATSEPWSPQSVQRVVLTSARPWFRWPQVLSPAPKGLTSMNPGAFVAPRPIAVRAMDKCPEGYPRLAATLDSNENFMLYRRFGFLQTRLLLYKQDELRELEAHLDLLDKSDEIHSPGVLRWRESDDAGTGERKHLMAAVDKKFREYASLLSVARDIASFNRPPARDYLSVKRYFDQTRPLCYAESYIYNTEDIVALKPNRERAWLDGVVERVIEIFSKTHIMKYFSSKNAAEKVGPDGKELVLISRERIDSVITTILMILIPVLFIVPIYVLWAITRKAQSRSSFAIVITLVLAFTMAFCAALHWSTKVKRHELLSAAAAYCAVLVVFVGNVPQASGN